MAKEYKTSILSVYDESGNKIPVPAIRGKGAYEYAQDNGYAGSEEDYKKDMNPDNIEAFIVSELAKRGQLKPEFAESMEWLEANGNQMQLYVLPDGMIYAYMLTEVESKPTYTNVLPLAINTDGSIYNDIGYKTGWRLNSSLVEKESSTNCLTGYIPVTINDVIRLKNVKKSTGNGYLVGYYSNFASDAGLAYETVMIDDGSGGYTVTMSDIGFMNNVAYIRFSIGTIDETSIITINEEITEGGGTTTGYAWVSTGHAFVPADYEGRIIDVEEQVAENAVEIENLKNGGASVADKSLMYISPEGDDSNNGLTKTTPKKTVKACVKAGAKRIVAKRGIYKEFIQLWDIGELEIVPMDNDVDYAVGTERELIVFDTSDTVEVSALTTYNSIKRVAYNNANNTQFDKVFIKKSQTPLHGNGYGSRYNSTVWLLSEDEKTVCIKLKPVLTVAECEAETNTFSYVDGYIYINADMTSVIKIIVPTNWESGIYINGAERLVLKEVEVRFAGGYNIDIRNCSYFDFYKCACKYTSYASGFHPFNSNGIMTACYATKNFDGYGISGYGHTTYVDCVSEFNFDDGMSHHNGTSGTVIGGRYEGNGKGGCVPAYGAKVNIYGGLYKDNVGCGIGYLWASGLEAANGTIDGAILVGNTVGLSVQANCEVIASNCIYEDNATDKEIKGNLTEYNNSYTTNNDGNEGDSGENDTTESNYTNKLPLAVNSSGGIYTGTNGEKGYNPGYRVSSSGTEKSADSKYACTGFIPVVAGDIIRIKNAAQVTSSNDGSSYCMAYFFDSAYTKTSGAITMLLDATYTDGVSMFTIPSYSNIAYFRVTLIDVTSNTIITVNEEIPESNSTVIPDYNAQLDLIKNWKYPIHEDAPVFLLETNKPAISSTDRTTEAIYAKYDALMAANSHYITRVDCGMASDSTTPIYVYHFKEPEPHYENKNWSETKPTILVCSGVHPTEQSGVWSMYYAMEEITNNAKLRDLRRNVHFIVMPMINPTAFSDSTYGVRNPDGIQVHYNFEVDFGVNGAA